MELVADSWCGAGQVSGAEGLQVLEGHFSVVIGVEGLEEGVDVFFLRVVGGIEYSVGIGQDRHGLYFKRGTLTGSIDPVLSLS